MAYFANGTEGEIYERNICEGCLNYKLDEESDTYGCPILDLHFMHNYDQFAEHEKDEVGKKRASLIRSILERFISDKTKVCTMYVPAIKYENEEE